MMTHHSTEFKLDPGFHWISLEPCDRFWEDFALYCYEHKISVTDPALVRMVMIHRYSIDEFYARPGVHAMAGFKSEYARTIFALKWT